MMKFQVLLLALVPAGILSAKPLVNVFPTKALGPVGPMHAVNNGPYVPHGTSQLRGNANWFRMAKIPYARTHDSVFCANYGGAHTVDIAAVFPNFDADDQDPKSYDFTLTDHYLRTIRDVGTRPFFRLGQSIEHTVKKYGVLPPKDFDKWARVCERIVAHYNDGWADGFHWQIDYWEIWNEPDLDTEGWPLDAAGRPIGPRTWGGTTGEFLDLFEKATKLLKARHPVCKVGGPALAWRLPWAELFLSEAKKRGIPLDFFSWHHYMRRPTDLVARANAVRKMLDDHGYAKAESICNEWNYRRNWSGNFPDNVRFFKSAAAAAFNAATMALAQGNAKVDMLMYYDAQPCEFNGLFDDASFRPLKGYWPFYAWSRLAALGTRIATEASDADDLDLAVTAARSPDGDRVGVMLARFAEPGSDAHWAGARQIQISVPALAFADCHMTDDELTYTQLAPVPDESGRITVQMMPQSFCYLEFKKDQNVR